MECSLVLCEADYLEGTPIINNMISSADGFIGSHLTEALVQGGYNVRAFVYYNSFNSWGWLDESPAEIKGA